MSYTHTVPTKVSDYILIFYHFCLNLQAFERLEFDTTKLCHENKDRSNENVYQMKRPTKKKSIYFPMKWICYFFYYKQMYNGIKVYCVFTLRACAKRLANERKTTNSKLTTKRHIEFTHQMMFTFRFIFGFDAIRKFPVSFFHSSSFSSFIALNLHYRFVFIKFQFASQFSLTLHPSRIYTQFSCLHRLFFHRNANRNIHCKRFAGDVARMHPKPIMNFE